MWSLLYCCVILAIANPLWVQALPAIITSGVVATNHSQPSPKCPENEVFDHEGTTCELTCAMPVPQKPCNKTKVPACQCNAGYVRDVTGKCIDIKQCSDSIPFNVEYNVSESTPNEGTVDEFLPTVYDTQVTNEPEDTVSPQYDIDEYKDSHEDSRSYTPLNVEYNVSESTPNKGAVDEFLPTVYDTQVTNEPEDTVSPRYEIDEYDDLYEDSRLYNQLIDEATALLDNLLTEDDILLFVDEYPKNSYIIELFKKIISQHKTRKPELYPSYYVE